MWGGLRGAVGVQQSRLELRVCISCVCSSVFQIGN